MAFQTLQPPAPDPFAGQNVNAFMGILQTLGHYEGLRRRNLLQTDILRAIGQEGDQMQNIAGAVSNFQPQYSTGARGLLQRIGAQFAPQMGMEDMIIEQAVRNAFGGSYGLTPAYFRYLTPEQKKGASQYEGGLVGRPQHPSYGESSQRNISLEIKRWEELAEDESWIDEDTGEKKYTPRGQFYNRKAAQLAKQAGFTLKSKEPVYNKKKPTKNDPLGIR